MNPPRDLRALFDPASVAVVGASDDPRKWGNWLARHALRGEHRRAVHLVNRGGAEVLGRRAYRSLAEVPAPVGLAVLVVPEKALEPAVDDALGAGAQAIIAISGGTAGTGRDEKLAARVRAAGAVLVGPNCLGVFDADTQLELVPESFPPGTVGLISQSGNLALEVGLLAAEARLGFSRFVSLGNQADLEAAELVDAFASHERTRAIAVYLEDFRDGRAFARAARNAAERGKPVVLLTVGLRDAIARAVQSHTGALASDEAAIEAACQAAAIELVRTPGELVDMIQALVRGVPPRGRRVAVLADGGGHGAIAASVAGAEGLELPELGPATVAALRAQLPETAACGNPIDLAGGGEQDIRTFGRAVHVLLRSGEVDAVLMTGYFGGYHEYAEAFGDAEIAEAAELARAVAQSGRPLVTHTMYAGTPAADALRRGGVAVYRSVEQATSTLARLVRRAGRGLAEVPGLPAPAAPVHAAGYPAARTLLLEAGVAFTPQRTVTSLRDALAAAAELGYPVVLKALGMLHKSDAGGVVLGLADEAALARAFSGLSTRLRPPAFGVEPMAPLGDGVELLIGARWDVRFGPIAVAGLGGIYTEVLRDIAVALAPVSAPGARRMLQQLRAWPLLAGHRGRPPLDTAAAGAALAALSHAAAGHPEIAEIEVNPLLVLPRGVLALDARMVTTGRSAADGVHLYPAPARVAGAGRRADPGADDL